MLPGYISRLIFLSEIQSKFQKIKQDLTLLQKGHVLVEKPKKIKILREKCPNTEFFLVRIFLYSPVFGLNTGIYGPEKTPYLDTFHAVRNTIVRGLIVEIVDAEKDEISSRKRLVVTGRRCVCTALPNKHIYNIISNQQYN